MALAPDNSGGVFVRALFAAAPPTDVCTLALVKRKELERKLGHLGWHLLRHGGNHDIWTNGREEEPGPRHPEINEDLARKILKKAGAQ